MERPIVHTVLFILAFFLLSAHASASDESSAQLQEVFKDYLPAGGPVDVQIGLRVEEITDIDQRAERFSVVATLQMRWHEPALGFQPDPGSDPFRVYRGDDFFEYVRHQNARWPRFIFFNQQGKRFSQDTVVLVTSDGKAFYFERFTVTLQAPYFHFSKFPFDSQEFYIDIDLLAPDKAYVFSELEGYSDLGKLLGLEEWDVTQFDTDISTTRQTVGYDSSRFRFHLHAERRTEYYQIRIFVPICIIVLISWIILFLKDYKIRIDIASGNLLLFIAFNFVISTDLPRLSYLTFMDSVLFTAFAITSFSVIVNVILRRMEVSGRVDLAQRIDRVLIWAYPFVYLFGVLIAYREFF